MKKYTILFALLVGTILLAVETAPQVPVFSQCIVARPQMVNRSHVRQDRESMEITIIRDPKIKNQLQSIR